jgi:hypothetical protein
MPFSSVFQLHTEQFIETAIIRKYCSSPNEVVVVVDDVSTDNTFADCPNLVCYR